ncbi:MAG: hypothetical protein AABX39_04915 [Nanoarchaeota archaeon]
MTTPNAFFIDSPSFWKTLYAPNKFALLGFERGKDGFVFSSSQIIYFDDAVTLKNYEKAIADKKIKVMQELVLPENVLESIAQKVKECRSSGDTRRMFDLTLDLDENYSVEGGELI